MVSTSPTTQVKNKFTPNASVQSDITSTVITSSSSRKDLSFSEDESKNSDLEDEFIGKRIKVYWPNHGWYEGKVVSTSDNPQEGSHEILYDDSIDKGPVYEQLIGDDKAEYKILCIDKKFYTGMWCQMILTYQSRDLLYIFSNVII